jgi:multicomponent Na+:H+ antiporter subunit G
MSEIIMMVLIFIGTISILAASIGIVRMPDFYLRLSVTIKAATLGIGLMLFASSIFFDEVSVTTKVVAIIFFLFLTAPVGAHMIGRASYFIGVPLWKNSVIDELKGQYDKSSHELESSDTTINLEKKDKEEDQ